MSYLIILSFDKWRTFCMLSSTLASWRTEMGKTKNKKLPENCFNFTSETSKQIQDDYRK